MGYSNFFWAFQYKKINRYYSKDIVPEKKKTKVQRNFYSNCRQYKKTWYAKHEFFFVVETKRKKTEIEQNCYQRHWFIS